MSEKKEKLLADWDGIREAVRVFLQEIGHDITFIPDENCNPNSVYKGEQ